MGLGLSIAYNIVKLHKGTIKVDNKNIEKGTRMIVKLPIKQNSIFYKKLYKFLKESKICTIIIYSLKERLNYA